MKTKILVFVFTILICFPAFSQSGVYFESGESTVTVDIASQIDALIEDKIEHKNHLRTIVLEGHTDSDGNDEFNEQLSLKRTENVKRYMVKKGFPESVFEMEWHGENQPVAANADENSKRMNRRVEIQFYYKLIKPELQVETKQSQFFSGYTMEDIEVRGDEGTIIRIPENSLVYKSGIEAMGKVEIELKEFYKNSDIVRAALHTHSGDEMLETGGMIYLDVTVDGKEVMIKDGEEVEVIMPTDEYQEGMNVFYGNVDDDNRLDWEETDEPSITQTEVPADRSDEDLEVLYTSVETQNRLGRYEVQTREVQVNQYASSSYGYRLSIKKDGFGMINCDRFRSFRKKTNLIVDIENLGDEVSLMLVFERINSVLQGGYDPMMKKYVFKNVPQNKKAKLVAFSKIGDSYLFDMKKIKIEDHAELKLASITEEEFEQGLGLLDK